MTRPERLYIAAVLACAVVLCCLECSAEAQPARVDARQVCSVKDAIRFGQRAWTPRECERVASALNETANPRQMLAVAIVESDLRERGHRVTLLPDGRIAHDIGLMGVRCVTVVGAHAEEHGSSTGVTSPGDETQTPRDRCTNGAARGLYASQLFDPSTNVRTAAAVLATHGGSLDGYNGCVERKGRRCTYAKRIAAIEAALDGVVTKVPWKRTRKQIRQIVEAVEKEPRS